MNKATWDLMKPIAAQALRDVLRTVGAMLLTHGLIHDGAGVQAFIGAGMTLGGLFWGWFITTGYLKVAALLKKLTDTRTQAAAIAVAKQMPPAAQTGAAVDAKVAAVVKVLLVAFALSAFLAAAPVQAQGLKLVKPTGNIVNDIAAATAGGTTPGGFRATGAPVTDIQTFLNAKFLPDLQYALKLATASKNTVTADCYQAWIDIITTQQTAVKNADGTDITMPDPHVITEFEKIVELRNALQPESPFMIKCSPVASMVKLDIAKFMGVVISGGVGLATMVPGL